MNELGQLKLTHYLLLSQVKLVTSLSFILITLNTLRIIKPLVDWNVKSLKSNTGSYPVMGHLHWASASVLYVASDIAQNKLLRFLKFLNKPSESLQKWVAVQLIRCDASVDALMVNKWMLFRYHNIWSLLKIKLQLKKISNTMNKLDISSSWVLCTFKNLDGCLRLIIKWRYSCVLLRLCRYETLRCKWSTFTWLMR